jgi:gamma-glutamyltranspeptidase
MQRERAKLMDAKAALAWDKVPSFGSLQGDTIYVAAVDRDGTAVSLIQSVYGLFGSGIVAGNTGVVLQNRGAYFSLDPGHPNRLEPGKIPLHTLIASVGKRDGKLWSVLGCMGADGQPQIQLQAYIAMIDFGLDIQEALENAALPLRPLLPGRGARHVAHGSALSAGHHRQARTETPHRESLALLA